MPSEEFNTMAGAFGDVLVLLIGFVAFGLAVLAAPLIVFGVATIVAEHWVVVLLAVILFVVIDSHVEA